MDGWVACQETVKRHEEMPPQITCSSCCGIFPLLSDQARSALPKQPITAPTQRRIITCPAARSSLRNNYLPSISGSFSKKPTTGGCSSSVILRENSSFSGNHTHPKPGISWTGGPKTGDNSLWTVLYLLDTALLSLAYSKYEDTVTSVRLRCFNSRSLSAIRNMHWKTPVK